MMFCCFGVYFLASQNVFVYNEIGEENVQYN
jgi:hypothetical protein